MERKKMTDKQLANLGQHIAGQREKKGLSLRALASELGVDAVWVLKLERGQWREPSPEKLAACAEALGIKSSQIDRLTGGYLSGGLIASRTYMRARYDLTPEQTDFIEAEIAKLKGKKEVNE